DRGRRARSRSFRSPKSRDPQPPGSKLAKAGVDPMALLEAACEIEDKVQAEAASEQPAQEAEPPRIVKVQTVSIPWMVAKDSRPETSSSSTPSSSLSPSPVRGRPALTEEESLGPLERYLLRSGEILENIQIQSRALAHPKSS
ncbi:unnamed protein product, partial [Effrenium voratum]